MDQIGASQKGTRPENDIPHSDVLPLWSLFLARWSKTAVTPFCIRCYVPFCKQTAEGSTNRTEPKYGLTYKPAALMECLPTHFPMTITYLNSKKTCCCAGNPQLFWNIQTKCTFSVPFLLTEWIKFIRKILGMDYRLQWISSWFTKDFTDNLSTNSWWISNWFKEDFHNINKQQNWLGKWICQSNGISYQGWKKKIKWKKIIPNDLTTRTIRL